MPDNESGGMLEDQVLHHMKIGFTFDEKDLVVTLDRH
jgi:hypothetical protein